jgi:hypothetical protein
MATFKKGDLVRIRKEWKDNPNDNHTYIVDNVNEVTNRYYITAIDTGMALPPQELVTGEMIELAQ